MAKKTFNDDFNDSDAFESIGDDMASGNRTPEEFEAEAERQMKILRSPKASAQKRIAAAQWLGDSGEVKAIPVLRQVYLSKEKDSRVKAAVAYALGQFRALENALKRDEGESVGDALDKPENQWVLEHLSELMVKDKPGKRLAIPVSAVVIFEVFLVITLIGLIAANVVVGGDAAARPTAMPTINANMVTTSQARPVVVAVQNDLNLMRADMALLLGEVESVAAGNNLNCGITFNNPPAVTFDAEQAAQYPAVSALVEAYNAQQSVLAGAKTQFDTGCARETKTLIALEQTGIRSALDGINTSLSDIQGPLVTNALNEVSAEEGNLQATATALMATAAAARTPEGSTTPDAPQTPEVSPTPAETETPTPTATPTINIRSHTGELFKIIDDTRTQNNQLKSFIEAVRDRNDLGGCRIPAPTVADDYALSPEDAAALPRLQETVTQVNVALALSRSGWNFFTQNCTGNTIGGNVPTALSIVQTVEDALKNAENMLTELR